MDDTAKKNVYRIAIAAGGTGGHLFPACALAHQLAQSGNSLLFLGGKIGSNPFFEKDRFPYEEISCSRLKSPLFPMKIAQGFYESVKILKDFQPALLVGFGSYYTVPVLLAALWLRIPYILHEQNSIPGKVNRLFSRGAKWSGIHFPEAQKKLKSRAFEVEMPLRAGFEVLPDKQESLHYFGLSGDLPVLLVFGGSQGARALNNLMLESAPHLRNWQVLHFTGNADWTAKLQAQYRAHNVYCCVKTFEKDMPKAWQAADLVISRSGAASIAEQIACAVPGLLIPYPHATDQHQEANANFMADSVGGAIKCSEMHLNPTILVQRLQELSSNLKHMQEMIYQFKQKRKLPTLCQAIEAHLTT